MKRLEAKILSNEKIQEEFYRISAASSYLAKKSKPGQFVEVKCSAGSDPLLRRPLGVHRIRGNSVELLYKVIGKGTEALSHMKKGDILDVIGPLGNGFAIRENAGAILVAGGHGVAPLLFLAEQLMRTRRHVQVFIGAKTKKHVLCAKEFKQIGCELSIATEDGSMGHKGFVTDLLRKNLATGNRQPATIYACGPVGMLRAVSEIAQKRGVACQVSLEEKMACGVGVCLGCPVKIKGQGYKMVCKDGPVFNAGDVAW
jgi:dihydroorotate dehydrogenase electron transfer subunit